MGLKARARNAHTYTMRELNHNTAKVIQEINDSGSPAIITRQGRMVALITPLANERVEAAVLGAVLDSAETVNQLVGSRTLAEVIDGRTVADDLDLRTRHGS